MASELATGGDLDMGLALELELLDPFLALPLRILALWKLIKLLAAGDWFIQAFPGLGCGCPQIFKPNGIRLPT
jgi:hypothetical protein